MSDDNFVGSEAQMQALIRLAFAGLSLTLWRNNRGAFKDATGRWVRFGLGNDSSKIDKVFKTPDLIGLTDQGRFVGIECKRPGWGGPRSPHEIAQKAAIDYIRQRGGVAGFATSIADVHDLLAGRIRW